MAMRLMDTRKPTWASFTKQFPEGITAMDAVDAAGLEELVVKAPMYVDLGNPDGVDLIEGKYAMIVPGKNTFLGVAGEGYDFLQNRELAELLDATLTPKYPVIAAGQTPDGAGIVFVLDMGMQLVGGEEVHQYFIIAEARTVGVSLKWALTPTRIQCLNTLMTAFRKASTLLSARHDRNFRSNVGSGAHLALQMAAESAKTMQLFDAMARRKITEQQFADFLEYIYPIPAPEKLLELETSLGNITDEYANNKLVKLRKAMAYSTKRADEFWAWTEERFDNFETTNPELRGTVWAAYNAAVEIQDFLIPANGTWSAIDSLLGGRADVKTKALNFAAALCGAV